MKINKEVKPQSLLSTNKKYEMCTGIHIRLTKIKDFFLSQCLTQYTIFKTSIFTNIKSVQHGIKKTLVNKNEIN